MFGIRRKSVLLLGTLSFLVVASFNSVGADELDVPGLQQKIIAAVDKVMPAVVAINDRGSVFSGVITSKDGYVISAGHAVRPNRSYTVMLGDGRSFRAEGLGVNERVDMAMLKITEPVDLPAVEMGHSSALVKDQPCIGISYPGRYNSARGAVVRFGYITKPITNNEGMIKSTAKMEPGDSGGALIDLDGKLIGIHSNIRRSAAENYDVPIDSFKKYMKELKEPVRFDIDGWPSLPKLGFRGDRAENGKGVQVLKVNEGGLAESAGLQPKDVVIAVAGKNVTSSRTVYDRLIELRSTGVNRFEMSILRNGKPADVTFTVSSGHPTPIAYPELRNLENKFTTLESRLDDVQFIAHSSINGKPAKIRATQIHRNGRGNLISKSTRIGENPQIELADGSRVAAEIVARDQKNDLVLLNAKLPPGGIDLSKVLGDLQERRGTLLLTPDSNGAGSVSIWGSKYSNIPRTETSGGFLGVQLGVDSGKVIFDRVHRGAARTAGLKSGDVLLRLNDTTVKRNTDVFRFLRAQDPNTKITAVVLRDDEEISKEVVLGTKPDDTGHVADDLVGGKSKRRDGFSLAISHDANLRPEDCGGPVFDTQGRFLGINIARCSRTRCYVIPKTILKRFVDENGQ